MTKGVPTRRTPPPGSGSRLVTWLAIGVVPDGTSRRGSVAVTLLASTAVGSTSVSRLSWSCASPRFCSTTLTSAPSRCGVTSARTTESDGVPSMETGPVIPP